MPAVRALGRVVSLGDELANAETRSRERDTLAWSGAELELAVTMESSATTGVSFRVVNGDVTEGESQTSKLKINLWPAVDGERPRVGA